MKQLTLVMFAAAVLIATQAGDVTSAKEYESQVSIGKSAPQFELTDLDGKAHKLSDYKGKYVVLEWTNPDCPFVKKHYQGNMQALQKRYGEKGVVWLSICSSAPGKQGHYDAKVTKKIAAERKIASAAYLNDEDGTVGRIYGAKTTPHMYVIDPEGKLIYAGAIDSKASTNVDDIKTATNYVQSCLDAAMSGVKVEVQTSTPYGCSVKYAKKAD